MEGELWAFVPCLAFWIFGLFHLLFGPILQLLTARVPFQSQQANKDTERYTVPAFKMKPEMARRTMAEEEKQQ